VRSASAKIEDIYRRLIEASPNGHSR
jgi:hypothetical protein